MKINQLFNTTGIQHQSKHHLLLGNSDGNDDDDDHDDKLEEKRGTDGREVCVLHTENVIFMPKYESISTRK